MNTYEYHPDWLERHPAVSLTIVLALYLVSCAL